MIEYIRGELTELTPAMAVVEAAGVGYALNISLNTYTGIQGKKKLNCMYTKRCRQADATILIPFSVSLQSKSATYTDCSSR